MEDDQAPPRSVKDRIALLQQQSSSSRPPNSAPPPPHAPSFSASSPSRTSPRIPPTQLSSLYNQSQGSNNTSPAKGLTTSAHSNVNVSRPESPTNSRAASPAKMDRGDRSLQDTLVNQLVGGGGGGGSRSRGGSVKLSSSPNSTTPRSQSPAPPPPLPRRISSPSVNEPPSSVAQTQLRHRSQTVDPTFSQNSSNPSRPPPQLPPRRSSTLDPIAATTPSSATLNPSISSSLSITSSNQNSSSSSASRGNVVRSSSPSSQGPPLPRRKPTLPVQSSTSPNISPRTPVTSSFEPPPPARNRPLPAPKPTLNDPLSARSSSQSRSRTNGVSRNNSSSPSPTTHFKIRPIDPRARKRYEQLFYQCLSSQGHDTDRLGGGGGNASKEEQIEGELVRMIWERSRLPREVLRAVWNEISPNSGTLDREGFVRGMWLIDEELRRRQRRD